MAKFPSITTIGTAGDLPVTLPAGRLAFQEHDRQIRRELSGVLQTTFGRDRFLPYQPEIMTAIFRGQDAFFVLPTGGGKTWAFAVPSCARYLENGSSTVIVSPLVALIRDQAGKFEGLGIPTACFTGDMSQSERKEQNDRVLGGRTAFILCSPERFITPSFQDLLRGANRQKVGRIVVDEAHCIYEWGQDFRGAYSRALSAALELEGGRPQIIACTATATPQAQDLIRDVLGLKGGRHFELIAPIDRTNLDYRVRCVDDFRQAKRELLERLKSGALRDGKSLVYCLTRAETEEVAEFLSNRRVPAVCYHAGMEPDQRRATEADFRTGRIRVVAATCAFGMGIDIPDIAYTAHLGMPASLSEYAQQTGRTARNGQPGICELFYRDEDILRQIRFMQVSHPSYDQLMARYQFLWEKVLPNSAKRKEVPDCFFKPDYSHLSRENRWWENMDAAIDCQMMNRGIYEVSGYRLHFYVKPSQLADRLPRERTKEEISFRWDQDMQELALMAHVAESRRRNTDSRLTIRQQLLQHFTHNTLVNSLTDRDPRALVAVRESQIRRVMLAVNESDYVMSDLVRALRDQGSRLGGRIRGVASLSGLSLERIECIVRHAASRDYLRLHTRGARIYVSLAEKGVETLARILPPEEHDRLTASDNFNSLRKRIGHFSERRILEDLVRPWFDRNVREKYSPAELADHKTLEDILYRFQTAGFSAFGRKINGAGLTALFYSTSPGTVTVQDTRGFLLYLFPRF